MHSSAQYFAEAQRVIPGGVNSPARAMEFVGCTPPFIRRGQGSRLYDVEGRSYIDYVLSWGSAIVGHSHHQVVHAVQEAAIRGLSFGAPTAQETDLCSQILSYFPHMHQLRLVCSGTEACMSAVRLARAYWHRKDPQGQRYKIVKFSGHYHGHSDSLLVRAGSGVATCALPDSPGVTPGSVADTLTCTFNQSAALEELFAQHKEGIAAVILEVIMGNGGLILPQEDFLLTLQGLCQKHGALIIADEVMSGFRANLGGAASLWDLRPDITVLGKVIGGGLPLAAYGGSDEIMSCVAPRGAMYQAGTLAGNPLAVASGIKTLEVLSAPGAFEQLSQRTQKLAQGMEVCARSHGVPLKCAYQGGMFGYFFSQTLPRCSEDVARSDLDLFRQFFKNMLDCGIYLPPSPYESCFLSLAHSEEDLTETLQCCHRALKQLGGSKR